MLFENRRDALEQMIVTAAEDAEDSRQHPERLEVGSDLPDRRTHDRTDENDIAAALPARKPAERAELAEGRPVVRIGLDAFWIAQPRMAKSTATPALAHRIGDRIDGRLPPPQMIASGPSSAAWPTAGLVMFPHHWRRGGWPWSAVVSRNG